MRGYGFSGMTSDKPQDARAARRPAPAHHDKSKPPEWANGLRQLYDAVVEEPLPDSFRDLLSKLDSDD